MSDCDQKAKRDYARNYAMQKAERYKYNDFMKCHADDTVLMENIWRWKCGDMKVFPKCKKKANYYKIRKRTQYACSQFGNQITPLKNTIFYRSHVPLSMWL